MKKIIVLIAVAAIAAFAFSSCKKEEALNCIYSIEVLDASYSIQFAQLGWPEIEKSLKDAGFEDQGANAFSKKGEPSKMNKEVVAAVQKGVDAYTGGLLTGCVVTIKRIGYDFTSTVTYK